MIYKLEKKHYILKSHQLCIDRHTRYNIYTDETYRFHKYRKNKPGSPYVYIDTAINSNGNMDGYIFNVPFVKYISVIALFLDPRKLLE